MGGCGALRRCGCARTYEGIQFLCVKFRLGLAGEPTICSHCYSVPYMKIPANNQVFFKKSVYLMYFNWWSLGSLIMYMFCVNFGAMYWRKTVGWNHHALSWNWCKNSAIIIITWSLLLYIKVMVLSVIMMMVIKLFGNALWAWYIGYVRGLLQHCGNSSCCSWWLIAKLK